MLNARKLVLSLGSNQGDTVKTLQKAVFALGEISGIETLALSHVYRTCPVDYLEQPDFLNLVLSAKTNLGPFELLAATQEIERALGRVRGIPKGPRTLDIDLIFLSGVVIDTPRLTLPHPRAAYRNFVLEPLKEVDSLVWEEIIRSNNGHELAEGAVTKLDTPVISFKH